SDEDHGQEQPDLVVRLRVEVEVQHGQRTGDRDGGHEGPAPRHPHGSALAELELTRPRHVSVRLVGHVPPGSGLTASRKKSACRGTALSRGGTPKHGGKGYSCWSAAYAAGDQRVQLSTPLCAPWHDELAAGRPSVAERVSSVVPARGPHR